jgi:hypothetical protein
MQNEETQDKKIRISIMLFCTILIACISGAFTLGYCFGYYKFDKEKQQYYEENKLLREDVELLQKQLIECQNDRDRDRIAPYDVLVNGKPCDNMYLGVNSSGGKTDWKKELNGEISMTYPRGENWGTVYITVGEATQQLEKRQFKNFSYYSSLILELKGEEGDTIQIGMKDPNTPEVGPRHTLTLKKGWNIYPINLDEFKTVDLKHLYVVTEFVFSNKPQTLSVKKIRFE